MELTLTREQLLAPLNQIIGAVERKMTFPILANVLIEAKDSQLTLTGTDLEVELKSCSPLEQAQAKHSAITLPGKKLADICKMMPEQTSITLKFQGNHVFIRSTKSQFKLATMPVEEFPTINITEDNCQSFTVTHADFYSLLQRTHFSMAQQDVRYFLNGLLLDFNTDGSIQAVATDGHRLATNSVPITALDAGKTSQVILPRKTVAELMRLISPDETALTIQLSGHHICFTSQYFTLTSKLIDGAFPDYKRVIPKDCDKSILVDRDLLKQSLIRASILSSEKHRSVVLSLRANELMITANNPEQEEATETIAINYDHEEPLEIAFNVSYLLNILTAVNPGDVELNFKDSHSSVLITEPSSEINSLYVIMPMRI